MRTLLGMRLPHPYPDGGLYSGAMPITVNDLIEKLKELPPEYNVDATKSGSSIEFWEPQGPKFGYLFTDERPTRHLESRRERRR